MITTSFLIFIYTIRFNYLSSKTSTITIKTLPNILIILFKSIIFPPLNNYRYMNNHP